MPITVSVVESTIIVSLSDVVIRCLSGSDNIPPDDARLFVVGANMVRRIECFAKGPSWRLNEKIQMSVVVAHLCPLLQLCHVTI